MAFSQPVYNEKWESTGRDTETLAKAAMRELLEALGNENNPDPGHDVAQV